MAFAFEDLIRGEGEWRNMQDIVRKSFRQTFEQIQKQQDQISQLVNHVSNLKSQMTLKPNISEIEGLIESNFHRKIPLREDFEKFKQDLIVIRGLLDRKAGIRYVDDSLKSKVDKSEVFLKGLNESRMGDSSKIHNSISELKSKCDYFTTTIKSIQSELQNTAKSTDVRNLHSQMEKFQQTVSTFTIQHEAWKDKERIDGKIDVKSMEILLNSKAEKATLNAQIGRLERGMSQLDRMMTAIRLKMQDEELFKGLDEMNESIIGDLEGPTSSLLRNHRQSQSKFRSSRDESKYQNESSYDWGCEEGGLRSSSHKKMSSFPSKSFDFSTHMSEFGIGGGDGRTELLLSELWNRVQFFSQELKKNHQSNQFLKEKLSQVESSQLSLSSAVAGYPSQMEKIESWTDELRRKVEGLALGTTSIPTVFQEFSRINKMLSELHEQVHHSSAATRESLASEVRSELESQSKRVGDLANVIGRVNSKSDSLNMKFSSLEAQLKESHEISSSFRALQSQCDLSGTRFEHVREVAIAVRDLGLAVAELKASLASHEMMAQTSKTTSNNALSTTSALSQRFESLEVKCALFDEILSNGGIATPKVGLKKGVRGLGLAREGAGEQEATSEEIHSMLRSFGTRVSDITSSLSKLSSKMESLEEALVQMDSRIQDTGDLNSAVRQLSAHCDLSGTRYPSIRDMASVLKELTLSFSEMSAIVTTQEILSKTSSSPNPSFHQYEERRKQADMEVTAFMEHIRARVEKVESKCQQLYENINKTTHQSFPPSKTNFHSSFPSKSSTFACKEERDENEYSSPNSDSFFLTKSMKSPLRQKSLKPEHSGECLQSKYPQSTQPSTIPHDSFPSSRSHLYPTTPPAPRPTTLDQDDLPSSPFAVKSSRSNLTASKPQTLNFLREDDTDSSQESLDVKILELRAEKERLRGFLRNPRV